MPHYLGIDVSKKTLDAYHPSLKLKTFPNTITGFKQLAKQIIDQEIIWVFEPTGGYEKSLQQFCNQNAIPFHKVHPNKVRAFAKAKGLYAKTDALDAKLLHDYATVFNLSPCDKSLSPALQNVRDLLERRNQLIDLKMQETNRLETQISGIIIDSLHKHLQWLTQELQDIESQLQHLIENTQEVKETFTLLTSIPGVGKQLALTILTQLPESGKGSFKHLTALVGLAPYAKESGTSSNVRRIKGGRAVLRKILYMATVASLRVNTKIKQFYQTLINNHKKPKVALVACMRKLLAFIHAILKYKTPWNPIT